MSVKDRSFRDEVYLIKLSSFRGEFWGKVLLRIMKESKKLKWPPPYVAGWFIILLSIFFK